MAKGHNIRLFSQRNNSSETTKLHHNPILSMLGFTIALLSSYYIITDMAKRSKANSIHPTANQLLDNNGIKKEHAEISTQESSLIPALAGMVSGALAATLCYPTEAMKKRTQGNLPALGFQPFNLQTWPHALRTVYTGGAAFICSVGPTTLIQNLTLHAIHSYVGDPQSEKQKIALNMLSGGVGAIVSTTVEGTILSQHRLRHELKPCGPIAAIHTIMEKGNLFSILTGLKMLMLRESIFGGLALGLADDGALHVVNSTGASVLYWPAMISFGVAGALITHPADTISTEQQSLLHDNKPHGVRNAIESLWSASKRSGNNPIRQFYKGAGWRVGLFTGCMLTIAATREKIEESISSCSEKLSKP